MSIYQNYDGVETVRTAAEDLTTAEYTDPNGITKTIQGFDAFIGQNWDALTVKTGFADLDDAIGGGLLPHLYVLGGATSTGKTTFALNLADNVAKSGRPVCFFCMEMTRHEMMARSLSRITRTDTDTPLTENEILYHQTEIQGSPQKREAFALALTKYKNTTGKNIFFFDGRRRMSEIQAIACEVLSSLEPDPERETAAPVLFIDYLQILQPEDGTERLTEKQQIDKSLEWIMKIKEGLQTPVVLVSSYNRAAYYKDAGDNTSFKGSGEIEYSADHLLFLELVKDKEEEWKTENGKRVKVPVDNDAESFNTAMAEEHREIRLKITKNRGTRYGAEVKFDYEPKYNTFFPGFPDTAEPGESYNETAKRAYKRNNRK